MLFVVAEVSVDGGGKPGEGGLKLDGQRYTLCWYPGAFSRAEVKQS